MKDERQDGERIKKRKEERKEGFKLHKIERKIR